jgi:hypothetical protein
MPIVPGTLPANQLDTEDNRSRDFIAQGPDNWMAGVVLGIAQGGHGATTAAAARTALGVVAADLTVQSNGAYDVGLVWSSGAIQVFIDGVFVGFLQFQGGGGGAYLPLAGGTLSGDLYLPASSIATSGWTAAYINSDGRVSRGASSQRYKKGIRFLEMLGTLFGVRTREYQMKDGDGVYHVGYIAEELMGTPAERFVLVDDQGQPDSIDYTALHTAQLAELDARLKELEG